MKLLRTIVVATVALCALDLVLYSIAFSEWFIRLILQLFVCFGMPLPETSLETLALAVLKVLTYPVHSFLTGGNFLLLAAHSPNKRGAEAAGVVAAPRVVTLDKETARVLVSPRIVTLDNERASISVTRATPIFKKSSCVNSMPERFVLSSAVLDADARR